MSGFPQFIFKFGIILIFFLNQKNFPDGPFLFKSVRYLKVGRHNFAERILLGNIYVLIGPGLKVFILILNPSNSLFNDFAIVFSPALLAL